MDPDGNQKTSLLIERQQIGKLGVLAVAGRGVHKRRNVKSYKFKVKEAGRLGHRSRQAAEL